MTSLWDKRQARRETTPNAAVVAENSDLAARKKGNMAADELPTDDRPRGNTDLALTALEAKDLEGPIFRSFAEDGFRPWDAWTRLRAILRSNGGSCGLVGARGQEILAYAASRT